MTAEVRDGVGLLTLDRPAQRNPLSVTTMTVFTALLRELAANPEVGAIVVRAAGPAFSAATTCARWWDGPSTTSARCSPSAPR